MNENMQSMKDVFDDQIKETVKTAVQKLEDQLKEAKEQLVIISSAYEDQDYTKVNVTSENLMNVLYSNKYKKVATERLSKTLQRTAGDKAKAEKVLTFAYNGVANLVDKIEARKSEVDAINRGM